MYIAYRTYYRLTPQQNSIQQQIREVCTEKGFEHDGSFVYSVALDVDEEDTDKEARDKGIAFACKPYFGARCADALFGTCIKNRNEDESKSLLNTDCKNNKNMSIPNNGYGRPMKKAQDAINDICKEVQ
jgi:hypothetical protein